MTETGADCERERLPALKRRKVRKGTRSCWECKRRKIRCTFVAPTESSCDGCRSRRVECIGQEFHSVVKAANSKADRLDRVEALVEQLARRASTDMPSLLPYNTVSGVTCGAPTSPNPLIPGTRTTSGPNVQTKTRYDELSGDLLAVWPSQPELDRMTSVTVGVSVLFHGIVCTPYSSFLSKNMPSPREMLQLPPPGSHPVLIAHKLLVLGSLLQGIPTEAVKSLGRLGARYRDVMFQVVETASRLVTSNDDLVGSLEGIECIMIESMYQNNAGNLRRAWLTNRRAMVIAQSIGLHLGNSPLPTLLDVKTKERIDPEYMWCRLVISDRYLSLMLGLPQGFQESSFASPMALEGCAPMDRMERIEAVVGGLIIQRNIEDLHNLETTHEIDNLLQDAAASMPAQWWLAPDITSIVGVDANAFGETIRIMNQFTHYHLLVQLHLPYMLQSSADKKYDHSKITAVNASREILSRFVSFRGMNMIAAYCRGIDFIAFTASTTLCLAHIDAYRQYKIDMSKGAIVFHFLAHQRLGNRGLMERTLQSIERMSRVSNDAIACKIASILQHLLAIEAAVANGDSSNTNVSSEPTEQQFLYLDDIKGDSNTLCINIPYLGTIKIEHDGVIRYVEVAHTPCEQNARLNMVSKASHSVIGFYFEPNPPSNQAGQQSMREPWPSATGPAGYQTGGQSVQADWQAVPSYLAPIRPTEEPQATASNNEFFSLDDNPLDAGLLLVPALAEDVDDWTLQGVDMTLFHNFIRGAEDPAITRELPGMS